MPCRCRFCLRAARRPLRGGVRACRAGDRRAPQLDLRAQPGRRGLQRQRRERQGDRPVRGSAAHEPARQQDGHFHLHGRNGRAFLCAPLRGERPLGKAHDGNHVRTQISPVGLLPRPSGILAGSTRRELRSTSFSRGIPKLRLRARATRASATNGCMISISMGCGRQGCRRRSRSPVQCLSTVKRRPDGPEIQLPLHQATDVRCGCAP